MDRKAYPSDLTNAEWQMLQPLLPHESPIGHPRKVGFREILNGIFYVQREGCGWRGLLMISPLGERSTTTSGSGGNLDYGNKFTTNCEGNYDRHLIKQNNPRRASLIVNR